MIDDPPQAFVVAAMFGIFLMGVYLLVMDGCGLRDYMENRNQEGNEDDDE